VEFPSGKKPSTLGPEGENDFALRLCAVFASNNPFKKEIIQYVWDNRFPEGTRGVSPYDENVRRLVVQSGPPEPPDGWVRAIWAGVPAEFSPQAFSKKTVSPRLMRMLKEVQLLGHKLLFDPRVHSRRALHRTETGKSLSE